MSFTSPDAAWLGLWTIARFGALAFFATEAVILWSRRNDPAVRGRFFQRAFWAATPAAVLMGLCVWCGLAVAEHKPDPAPAAVAQLAP